MTTKQDRINSILKNLASISVCGVGNDVLAELDEVISEYYHETDSKGRNKIESVDEALEILMAFNL
jgi:hypothetical protein